MRYIFTIFIIVLLCAPSLGFAQTAAPQSLQVQGLAIDPFLIELDMATGETMTKTITLTNTTNELLTFNASINDFVPNGKTGQPLFLDSSKESNPRFSLSRWINIIHQPLFTIPPRGQTEVSFTISVPTDAEPGTHYGGILFGQLEGQVAGSGVAVQNKVGAIILVRLGKSQEKVQISDFFAQHSVYQHGPVEFLTTLHNFGNVHAKPKGDITIRNMWGVEITQVPVNRDASIVLPESERDFSSVWQNKLGFGLYTAEEVLYYGSPKLELRAHASFWIVPIKEMAIGVLVLLILSIIGYIGIRRYNQYIIKHFRDEN